MTKDDFSLLLVYLLMFFLCFVFTRGSKAHEWYPTECCGGHDCHRILDPREVSESGDFYVYQHMRFPKSQSRQSPDQYYHVCIPQAAWNGLRHIQCFFRPFSWS